MGAVTRIPRYVNTPVLSCANNPYRAGLVRWLFRIRIEHGIGQLVGRGIVHGNKQLPRLDRVRDK